MTLNGMAGARKNCVVHSGINERVLIMSSATSRQDAKSCHLAEQVDNVCHEAAESLHAVASSIRKGGQRGSKAVEDLAESAANKLDGAGSFAEDHNLRHTIDDSRQLAKKYPVVSLVLAAAAGFLTGFAIRRLTHACDKAVA
jgi:hypothetical protein